MWTITLMKQDIGYFYGSGESLVRISDRSYQPIDVRSILKKQLITSEVSDSLRVNLKMSLFVLAGFLIGGVLGELIVSGVLSADEFGFMMAATSFFQSLSMSIFLSNIFSAGLVGGGLGTVVGLLSLIQIPE